MIADEQQDQAALHALGLLDADEAAAFERAAAADPELGLLATEGREAAASLAFAAAPAEIAPPAALRARLLAEVSRREPVALPASPAPRARQSGWTAWVPWIAAAVAVGIAYPIILHANRLARENVRLDGQLKQVINDRDHWFGLLGKATNGNASLLRRVAVSQLEPTPNGPAQGQVTVVWDPAQHQGRLLVTRLRPPGAEHDYQLWAVEEGHNDPVSAGVVHVDAEGRAQTEFRPVDAGNDKVNAFALSLEPAGGSEKARGPILLLGKF